MSDPFTLECTCGAVATPSPVQLESIPPGGWVKPRCPGCGRILVIERMAGGEVRGRCGPGFRLATPEDIDALVAMGASMMSEAPALAGLTFEADRLASNLAYALDPEKRHVDVIVAEDPAARIIGAIVMGAQRGIAWPERTGHEEAFYVDSRWRREGVATELIRLFAEWCKEHDCVKAVFGTHTGLPMEACEAIALRWGFDEDVHGMTWSKVLR